MKRALLMIAVLTSLALVAAACSETETESPSGLVDLPAEVHVTEAWARSPMDDVGAVYFMTHNAGSQADALIAADCDCADRVEVHQTTMVDGEMKMQPVDKVELPPGEDFAFKPGDFHVMLYELAAPLEVGQFISITLTFENAEPVTVDAEVKAFVPEEGMGGMAEEDGEGMG